MSRTDVHAPAWVKERDPLWRSHFAECHNHSWYPVGHEKVVSECGHPTWKTIWKKVEYCDLDKYLAGHRWISTACRIRLVNRGLNLFCGCPSCTGKKWRRLERRVDRHLAKELLRAGRWDEVSGKRIRKYW